MPDAAELASVGKPRRKVTMSTDIPPDVGILKSPFPWFGGKSRIAPVIWQALGNVPNYVEPFFGSGAVLFGRPHAPGIETANDRDGFVCNVFRALQHDPEQTAHYADYPAHECDLHARHVWLRERREQLTRRLEGDPDYYDAQIAGWWLWGIALWIGSGWCNEENTGPWIIVDDDEGYQQLVRRDNSATEDAGRGVQRQLLHIGDAGRGVQRQLLHIGDAGKGVKRQRLYIYSYFQALQERLARVRFCCGDWLRVLGLSSTVKLALTGIVLDPPYAHRERDAGLYGIDEDVSGKVREWALAHGDDPLMRIVLYGYEGEHAMPASWRKVGWQTHGGMGNTGNGIGRDNRHRERLWLSPHCLEIEDTRQGKLF
jgi:hypothetical protein